MMNFLALFGIGNKDLDTAQNSGILSEPGDRLEARITDSNRKVLKVQKNRGNSKYSVTEYPSGTIVETKVTKPNK